MLFGMDDSGDAAFRIDSFPDSESADIAEALNTLAQLVFKRPSAGQQINKGKLVFAFEDIPQDGNRIGCRILDLSHLDFDKISDTRIVGTMATIDYKGAPLIGVTYRKNDISTVAMGLRKVADDFLTGDTDSYSQFRLKKDLAPETLGLRFTRAEIDTSIVFTGSTSDRNNPILEVIFDAASSNEDLQRRILLDFAEAIQAGQTFESKYPIHSPHGVTFLRGELKLSKLDRETDEEVPIEEDDPEGQVLRDQVVLGVYSLLTTYGAEELRRLRESGKNVVNWLPAEAPVAAMIRFHKGKHPLVIDAANSLCYCIETDQHRSFPADNAGTWGKKSSEE
ncbi:MAG: hypothetical protein AB7H80_03195 [Candidatus Kapaibacterium sp.]